MSWGKPETAQERLLTTILQPAAGVYAVGSYLRLLAYGKGLVKRHKAPTKVVSVGNLTCGGSGKTPVTIDLARRLIAAGQNVAILSRGYKRKSKEQLLVVSDGEGNIASCQDAGDEPYMMAHAVPQAKVIVSAKRAVAAEVAVNVYDVDVVLLDDGFQHFGLSRDCDLVLIDYNDDPFNDSLLPAGRLREPVSALNRADWVVITRLPVNVNAARLAYLEEAARDRANKAIITSCRFVPSRLNLLADQTICQPDRLSGVKVVAVSAIAKPKSFADQLSELKAQLVRQRTFPDHHWWRPQDIETLRRDIKDTGAELVVTTAKDAARLNPELIGGLPVAVLELETQWLGPVPLVDEKKGGKDNPLLAASGEGAGLR